MKPNKQQLERCADNIRALALSMVEQANSGHPGGALGGADFINTLFLEYLRYDPDCPSAPWRDRFFLDPGHMSPMLYAQLALCGFFDMQELAAFRSWGSATPGHPERDPKRMIENTSGPLGQGHTYAVGAAIAAKFLQHRLGEILMPQRIFAYISDGGIQEEISAGAGRIAGHLGLDNLVMFYDANDIQLSTTVAEVDCEDIAMKYRAWGWYVLEIDATDADAIRSALDEAIAHQGQPSLIIGHTVMAYKAVDSDGKTLKNTIPTHGQPLSKAGVDVAKTLELLGADPDTPFSVYKDVAALYAARKEQLRKGVARLREEQKSFAQEHPEQYKHFEEWFAGELPTIDWASIVQKENQATRSASAAVLSVLAENVENMIVSSADLSNSDKTDGFLKKTKSLAKGDFSGKFLQAGVSELTMAALCVGMAIHGGIRVACGTFFVFSDYMKPVVRMAALMELPVTFVWSHDAFRVGEDGPTHEPVEQEAQIRLMEHLHNHSGQRSMLVLRPADVHETTVAWKMAMENKHTPTALILSRQNITDLPTDRSLFASPYDRALQAQRGAYVVSCSGDPQVVLIASGSEVSTLEGAATLLREKGKRVRVVSVQSEGLFRNQPESYQKDVLPDGIIRFGLTAGLPVNLLGLVGDLSCIHGLESFGFSAPYTVLDEKFGFTPQAVVEKVEILNL